MNQPILIAILAGLTIFFFILLVSIWVYQTKIRNTRQQRENPNEWLLYRFGDKLYDVFFGTKYPEDVAVKMGINIEEYIQNCKLLRQEADIKSVVIEYIYGILALLLGAFAGIFIHIYYAGIGLVAALWFTSYRRSAIKSKAEKQKNEFALCFPRFMAMLATELEIGFTIDTAIFVISQKFDSLISREFLEAMGEVKLGASSWQEAMTKIAEMYGNEAFSDFVMDAITADNKGVSVADAVNRRVQDYKQKRLMTVRERASKTENAVLIPIAVFQFLPILAFILLPTLMLVKVL